MNNRNIKILEEGIIGIFKRRVMLSETTAQVRFCSNCQELCCWFHQKITIRRGSKLRKLKKEKKTRMRRNVSSF
jgi:carboxylesterase type B